MCQLKKCPNQIDILNICQFSFRMVLKIKQGYNRNISKLINFIFRRQYFGHSKMEQNTNKRSKYYRWKGGSITKLPNVLLKTQFYPLSDQYITPSPQLMPQNRSHLSALSSPCCCRLFVLLLLFFFFSSLFLFYFILFMPYVSDLRKIF